MNATDAYKRAESALEQAGAYFNRTKSLITEGNELIANLTGILNNKTASPEEIEKLANEVSSHLDYEFFFHINTITFVAIFSIFLDIES